MGNHKVAMFPKRSMHRRSRPSLAERYIVKENKNLYVSELGEVVNNIMKEAFPEIVDEVKLHHKVPLIVEIPDRHGTAGNRILSTSYVNEAIGLKL